MIFDPKLLYFGLEKPLSVLELHFFLFFHFLKLTLTLFKARGDTIRQVIELVKSQLLDLMLILPLLLFVVRFGLQVLEIQVGIFELFNVAFLLPSISS